MNKLGSAFLILAIAALVSAQPPQAPRLRPPQAPPMRGYCQCTGKGDCTCDPSVCFCRACSGRKTAPTSAPSATYTATFTLPLDVEAKTYEPGPLARRVGVPDMKVTPDQPIPRGTYKVTLTPAPDTHATAPLPVGPLNYELAYRFAQRQQSPLVVYVGTPAIAIPGAIVCEVSTFPETQAPAVVVSVPGNVDMEWSATLQGVQTAPAIKAAINKALFPPAPSPPAQTQAAPSIHFAAPSFGVACST